jgi:hypothetical protein
MVAISFQYSALPRSQQTSKIQVRLASDESESQLAQFSTLPAILSPALSHSCLHIQNPFFRLGPKPEFAPSRRTVNSPCHGIHDLGFFEKITVILVHD